MTSQQNTDRIQTTHIGSLPRPHALLDVTTRMLALLEAGAVSPPAITRYKLADAAEAHRVSESRHLQGKLVLETR